MHLFKIINKTLPALFCGMAFTAAAATYYVDSGFQGESPTGESWLSAFPSLNTALEAASTNGGGQIWIRAGHYKPEGSNKEATFRIPENTELYGGFRGNETNLIQRIPKANRTVLSGDIGRAGSITDNAYHVLTTTGDTLIDGFIIQRGNADSIAENQFGGGLRVVPGSRNVRVFNCTFEKNSAVSGGAIQVSLGELTLSNCTFYSNSADTGGAIASLGKSSLNIIDSTFSSNFAPKRGGAVIVNDEGRIEIENSAFLYNSTDDFGGAIAAVSTQEAGMELLLSNCMFNQNSARNDGGALGFSGAFIPIVNACTFEKNLSPRGAGAIAARSGTRAALLQPVFVSNRGSKGLENIGTDATSDVVDSPEEAAKLAAAAEAANRPSNLSKPESVPEPEARTLPDVYVFRSKESPKIKLRSLIADAPHTVLAFGDLTDDNFIRNYRNIEAAARDFYPQGLRFYYIYKYLKHPENNGYIEPFSSRVRAQHTVVAKEQLSTVVPWLYDTMDNETAQQLMMENGAEVFIFSRSGEEVYAGSLADHSALRGKLTELSAPVTEPFNIETLSSPVMEPINMIKSQLVPRVKISQEERFQPLKITPEQSRSPYFVKARVEGSETLLESGNGKFYLGFHIDPLFNVQWNNLGESIKYQLTTPAGVVAPSINSADRVTAVATDSEPREFILQARKLDLDKPLTLQVTYSIHTREKRNIEVSQSYLIYLQKDPFGGEVFGRQIPVVSTEEAEKDAHAQQVSAYRALLRKYDIDRNGTLTADEVIGRLHSNFQRIDKNSDGTIDTEEYAEYRAQPH
ncbi:hypothetical protein P9H32_01245 [Pontiella sp. NLcol2]|uniref:Probable pectate lyase C n=2 Tax=Pontiella agarivorans TaxID=3038953 RepID=A0ABU5MSR1_9BACT|nr:hypothetical protein [Pontiella agarivorans]